MRKPYRKRSSGYGDAEIGRVGLPREGRHDGRGRGSRAAGEGLVLHAAFVGAHADRAVACDLHEIDVRALREARRVAADGPSAAGHVDRFEVVDEFDVVRDARVEKPPAVARADLPHGDHAQLDLSRSAFQAADAGGVKPVCGIEELGLPADAPVFGEKREAAGAVAAHLAFRPVGVVITHRTVDLRVPGEGHQPVGSDAEMTVAQGCDKFRTGCEAAFAVVDQDEVVACSFVFCKCRLHFLNGYVLAKIVKLLKVLLIL